MRPILRNKWEVISNESYYPHPHVVRPGLAPLVGAVTAFFSGLWQSTAEPYMLNEEELGI